MILDCWKTEDTTILESSRSLIKIVNICNSMPDVEVFKSRLDTFWKIQNVRIDYTANITSTGDRSEFDTYIITN